MDADGRLRVPFHPDDLKETRTDTYDGVSYEIVFFPESVEHYYIPDEIAVKASTGELADVFMSYGYNGGYLPTITAWDYIDSEYEYAFELALASSNALEESLRRADFAGVYFERYMTESENMPEYYDGEDFLRYAALANKTETLDLVEVLLAQPEAYAQLTKEQRVALVKRVLDREKQGKLFFDQNTDYRTFFFACIAGELYLSEELADKIPADKTPDVIGAIQREKNPWLDTINRMELTGEEQKIMDKYFSRE